MDPETDRSDLWTSGDLRDLEDFDTKKSGLVNVRSINFFSCIEMIFKIVYTNCCKTFFQQIE